MDNLWHIATVTSSHLSETTRRVMPTRRQPWGKANRRGGTTRARPSKCLPLRLALVHGWFLAYSPLMHFAEIAI